MKRRPFPAGYCLTPTTELAMTERGPISMKGPSIQYVTETGDSYGQNQLIPPHSPSPTVDHSLVAGGAQRQ